MEGTLDGIQKIDGEFVIKRIRNMFEKKERDKMHMTGTLQKVIEENKLTVNAIPYTGIWGEVDSPNDIKVYNKNYELKYKIRAGLRFAGIVGMAVVFVTMCLALIGTGVILVTGEGNWLAMVLGIGCGFVAFMLLLLPMIIMLDTSS